ncbi:hypothetical protein [Anaeromusa sp.]|uniref:hypothetical protein n=1 Tax=Anaeromusa sp. TaxID=1872520 RepID=UPI002616093E|nr:hypothetical protein [Anaeromusa sp.]MDD3157031.1 hypothetical protein [Anaeromusa sp.]
MDDQKTFLLTVKITQSITSGDNANELLKELHSISPTEEFFAMQLTLISNNLPENKIDDLLHATKGYSKVAFIRLMDRLQRENKLTMNVLEAYRQQFGEDRDILLVELNILFKEGFEKNQKRIDEIMQVVT